MQKNIVRLLLFFCFIVVPVIGIFWFISQSHNNLIKKYIIFNNCEPPTTYKIGTIDPKFKLTNKEVSEDLQTAIKLLNAEVGKEIFVEAPDAKITINFTYDERTQMHEDIAQSQQKITEESKTLDQQIADYEKAYAALKQKIEVYNATVSMYNKKGGAPAKEYDKLVQQQNDLKEEGDKLNAIAKKLNIKTADFNEEVNNVNNNITEFNNKLKEKPEEGLYDPNNNTITIYYALNKNELIHTLAHEFGHALGLPHNSNVKSVMYPYSTQATMITPEDTAQILYACRDQDRINNAISAVIQYMRNLRKE